MDAAPKIDIILATLNSADVGSLESLTAKMRDVELELRAIEQVELADRANDAERALMRGDVAEFRRLRAFLQSKVGHLRP